ncbi:MAG: Pr6Pr family membrane protein [Bacilli bacterium]|jgi:hypothetical protein|nr:Pr6Pr family membrane protein [Bacilli bacterium]
MVIRNRLASLIYRAFEVSLAIATLAIVFASPLKDERPFIYFSTEVSIFACIIMILAFIFNFVDLIRHGISGVAAYVYMPFTLASVVYLVGSTIGYWILFPMINGVFWANGMGLACLLTHAALPLAALLDWLLFAEKGTVKWRHGLYYLVYPLFYIVYSELAHFIFQDDFFPYELMRPTFYSASGSLMAGNGGWNGVVVAMVGFLAGIAAVSFLAILINDILSGKFRRRA